MGTQMQFLMKRKKEASDASPMSALHRERMRQAMENFHTGPPEISPNEMEKTGVIGDGSFGTVFKGRCRSQEVAIKVLHRQDLDEQALTAFRKEVEIMSKIFHPNILLYMGACTIPGNMMIVTELMPRGDLEALLHDRRLSLSLTLRMKMAREAALGMTWLHGSNPVFVHRDLKTSNLLVDNDWHIKLCDFGLSQLKQRGETLKDGVEGAKGTPLWMAPEVMAGQQFNEKADIYSFGIVLWEILTRKEPFQEFDNYEEFRDAICNKHVRPPIPNDCHPALRHLIESCWHPHPGKRPTFPEIVSQLDYIIVDCAILDLHGRKLWKDYFLKKDKVKWPEFLRVFMNYIPSTSDPQIKILNIKCLHALLADPDNKGDEYVTMEHFGRFLNWFGPMVSSDNRQAPLMDRVRSVLKKSYFHGDVATRSAESMLTGKAVGTFLVRFSTSEAGAFTISKVHIDNSINHQRISHRPNQGAYYINNRGYGSLEELISKEAKNLNLVQACLGSRFLPLFVNQSISGYVQ